MPDAAHVLPRPGPLWGSYPMRAAQDRAPLWRRPAWRSGAAASRQIARAAAVQAQQLQRAGAGDMAAAARSLRARLRREGLVPATLAPALGLVCAAAASVLGLQARRGQCMAAAALLDNRMAEMATGEGKTLAVGLAAAVAALAGMPVHVVTANEYLAQRDALALAPLYAALGLRVAALCGTADDATRRAAYAHDVVYATARDLAFDHLRDRQALGARHDLERVAAGIAGAPGEPPLMRGLCVALLDEADNILLDEAELPLILSRSVPQAARRAFLWQALALARQLDAGRDYLLHAEDRVATLTPAGEAQLERRAAGLGGPWLRARYRREAVAVALAGLHAYHRDQHYLVRAGTIELIDQVSGRAAPGRVWSRGLHTVVAMKEGVRAPDETETVAQTTFQRFFQRYWRLGGISGTLVEARGELRGVYGAAVVRIPLHQLDRRRSLPVRVFATREQLFAAVPERVRALQAAGRPVLVGTDSVADSQHLARLLAQHGVPHRVLNAWVDAEEAAIIAQAGRSGSVTVATRMAGRGTDIALDAAARDAGGLHVLSCQDNPSRRLDRQLAGRAARHGDPGSVERWMCAPDGVPPWSVPALRRWRQWREEQRRALVRRSLLEQDLHWERRLAFAGASS